MNQEQPLQIQVDRPASRIDRFLAQSLPRFSRSRLQKMIRQGRVLVSPAHNPGLKQVIARPNTAVEPGDVILLHLPPPPPDPLQPEALPLDIIFEDEDLIVVNKAAGMVVHPAHGHRSGTLVNALLARYPELAALSRGEEEAAQERPGIVHRLDRDTSGLLVVARTPLALEHLRQQFKRRRVKKSYLALVFGQPPTPEGIIEVPLGRDPRHRQKMAPRPDGKPARTAYRLRRDFGTYSLLEARPVTGRTHQIRVHLAWLNCPVVGDTVYGRRRNALGLERQFLHAWRLRFEHPRRGDRLHFKAPLDEELAAVLAGLGEQQPLD